MNLKKIGKVVTSKSVGSGPSSYEKRIYRAVVLQRLRNTGVREEGYSQRKHNIGGHCYLYLRFLVGMGAKADSVI